MKVLICGMISIIIKMPPPSVTGKPTAKIDSWGDARFRMPMARLSVSSAAISGRASSSPEENTVPPEAATAAQPAPVRGWAAMGRLAKLSAMVASSIRWPSMARNISMATTLRKRASTMVWPPEERS